MTLNQLECFSVLAHHLNFTQAADSLFMTQPALSRTISALEQEVGIQLFYRSTRSVTLTPAGKAFLQECPAILESCRHSLEAARLAQKGYRGQISLGILRDHFDPTLVDIYRAMAKKYPEIHLSLQEYSHSELFRRFAGESLDAIVNFGLSEARHNSDPDRETLLLRRNQQCVVMSVDHPLAARPHLQMKELQKEDFVIMSRTSSQPGHDFLWKLAADAGFVPNVVAETSYVPNLLNLVACGVGVSTITGDWEDMVHGRVIFRPLIGVPFSNHEILWRKSNPNPSLPFLIATIRAEILPALRDSEA